MCLSWGSWACGSFKAEQVLSSHNMGGDIEELLFHLHLKKIALVFKTGLLSIYNISGVMVYMQMF